MGAVVSFPTILYPGAADQPTADSVQLLAFARAFAFSRVGILELGGVQKLSRLTSLNKLACELVAGLDESAIRSCITATEQILGAKQAEKWWRELQEFARPRDAAEVFRGL